MLIVVKCGEMRIKPLLLGLRLLWYITIANIKIRDAFLLISLLWLPATPHRHLNINNPFKLTMILPPELTHLHIFSIIVLPKVVDWRPVGLGASSEALLKSRGDLLLHEHVVVLFVVRNAAWVVEAGLDGADGAWRLLLSLGCLEGCVQR